MKTCTLIALLIISLFKKTSLKNFEILVEEPQILAKHFSRGIEYLQIAQGSNKENYSNFITLQTFDDKNSGCKIYDKSFDKNSSELQGILLADSDNCPLNTKIHYAQLAGAQVLFLKYIDDNINEAKVDESSFLGVRIPVLMLKASDALKITDVLKSTENMNNLKIQFTHSDVFDRSKNLIQIYMNSQPLNNPMIQFLRDLKEHINLFKSYEIDIKFQIGFCKSCRESKFMSPEPNCLSGGRYCIINSQFHSSEPVLETLRQICIRRIYGSLVLIDYLSALQRMISNKLSKFTEDNYENISKQVMQTTQINFVNVQKCLQKSFVSRVEGKKVNFDLDENTILKEEQRDYLKITKYNIFPLIIVNSVFYDKSINIRDFIHFGCENLLFDCRGFKTFKKYFLLTMLLFCLSSVLIIGFFCRSIMRKKMEMELDIKVNQAVEKYLITHPSSTENQLNL